MQAGTSPTDILKQYWGYDAFRPLQEEIIESISSGVDTLALLPTGGGKSLCYQVPALWLGGLTLVISPLIALMKDQVQQLRARNIPAAALYSGMSYREIDVILEQAAQGQFRLLYCAPERLKTEIFLARLSRFPLRLLAVDEAHCISEWGYDFRPAYLEIAEIRSQCPEAPCLALTASATRRACDDITHRLGFGPGAASFRKSFDRPNLVYGAVHPEDKRKQMTDFFKRVPGSGIVYVRNRKATEQYAQSLQQAGIRAAHYHAGLDHHTRSQRQQAWMEGRIQVMVATNAFGMGIDKPDVRGVVHMDVPDTPEAYYQEAGRAGRDGQKAFALVIANRSDRKQLEEKAQNIYPEPDAVRRVYHALGNYLQVPEGGGAMQVFDFELPRFAQHYNWPALETYQSLQVLQTTGYISLSEAVYLPSRIKFTIDYTELYRMQVAQPRFDQITKALLRMYGGLFDHYVSIREQDLARTLRMPVQDVIQQLNGMAQRDVVDYQPQKEKPQLTFLVARVASRHLDIQPAFLKERKRILQEKAKAMVHYVWQENQCRGQRLLRYFDEEALENCGHCDLCIRRQQKQSAPQLSDSALQKGILRQLAKRKTHLDDLRSLFSRVDARQLHYNLRRLEEDGQIHAGTQGWYALHPTSHASKDSTSSPTD